MYALIRNLILIVGWPVLISGSIYIYIKGRNTYSYVKGSLVGRITKVLVITMLVEMYSLGIVTTVLMFCEPKSIYLAIPIFLAWFVVFLLSVKTLKEAEQETRKIISPTK